MAPVLAERLARLDTLPVQSGGHKSFREGHCAMELVAWLAGEPHSASPQCACPVITAFTIRFNDRCESDEIRAKYLKPLLPKIIGTRATREIELQRGYLCADWAVHVAAPYWLDRAQNEELKALAGTLRAIPKIVDKKSARAAEKATRGVRDKAWKFYADAAAADAAADAAAADAAAADAAAYWYGAIRTFNDERAASAAQLLAELIALRAPEEHHAEGDACSR